MSIKDWPATERPREKLLAKGAKSLTDAELLAIFLRTGVSGKSAVDLARQLLSEFGNLRTLLDADLKSFSSHLGLGVAKFVQLQAVIEMGRRHLAEKLHQGMVLESPKLVKDFLSSQLRDEPHEVFGCLYMDSKHRMIGYENLFYGSISQSTVYPRQIIKRCLHMNAAAVIFAHNHPSGNNEPSEMDKILTKELIKALSYIDIQVVDHFIVGEGGPFSMAEWGMI